MGLIKYIIFIIVLLAHDPNFGSIFRENQTLHIAVTLLISFSLLETGYITAKQIKFEIYSSSKEFLIARFCRIYIPSITVVIVSFFLMTNSIMFLHSNTTVFNEVSKLDFSSKVFYVISHLLTSILPLMFIKYDENLHTFIYTFAFDDNSTSAIKLSIAPHLWTILPDILGMILVALLVYRKHFKSGIILFICGAIAQIFITKEIIINNLDTMWIFQNPISELLFFGSGFLFGFKNISIALNLNKFYSVIIGYVLVFAGSFFVARAFEFNFMPIYFYVICLILFVVACDFLWNVFAFNKIDMQIRDMGTHLYLWHFLILSLIYNAFKISMTESFFVCIFCIIFTAFFGIFFEKFNKKFIQYLKTQFVNRNNNGLIGEK